MKRYIFLLILLTSCAGFDVENDIFSGPFTKNNDEYFTHGTRIDLRRDETPTEQQTYSIGSNIYTPSTKKPNADPAILQRDRPYAGWTYGEYRDAFTTGSIENTIYGVQIGCVGPCSQAKWEQQTVHRLIGQGKPAWPANDEIKSEPGFIIELERDKKIYANSFNDLGVYGSTKLGNIIDNGGLGIQYRIGYNLDTFTSVPIVFKIPNKAPDRFRAYFFTKLEERAVAYNHLLDGSLFQTENHTVNSTPFVSEIDIGFSTGYDPFLFTYTYTYFSKEWDTQKGGFSFGGLNFKW